MDFSSLGGSGSSGPGPSSSATSGHNVFGSENTTLYALIAVALVVVFALVLVKR